MILVGIFLIVAYSQMQQSMVNVDVKSIEARALQGLYTLGVMFLSVGIALVVVASKCPKASIDATRDPVLILSILLSVTMLVLSSILVAKLSSTGKTWAVVLLVMSILLLICSGITLGSKHVGTASFGYCGME